MRTTSLARADRRAHPRAPRTAVTCARIGTIEDVRVRRVAQDAGAESGGVDPASRRRSG
jgi:hypothetical protein